MVGARVIRIVEVQRQNVVHLNRGEMSKVPWCSNPKMRAINTVCPGVIDTSRWDNKRDNTPGGRGEWERLETNIPMGRPGTGTDVASTIVFLCSDEGHWISGQSINVDGGQVSSH